MLERLLHGGLRAQGMPADALALATLKTGVALYALDAARGAGRRSGSRAGAQLALADAAGPIAPLFSPPGAGPRARAAAHGRSSWSPSWRRRSRRSSSRRRCGRRLRRSLQLTPVMTSSARPSAPSSCSPGSPRRPPRRTAADPEVRLRPRRDRAGAEHDLPRGEPAQAARRRLDHALQARPRAHATARVPRVDVIHLHHGVWLTEASSPLFAAGEEKTEFTAPPGFGWRYEASDRWLMNHMIHNLTPTEEEVYITYELDFIPAGSPAAAGMQEIETAWTGHGRRRLPGIRRQARALGGDRKLHLPGRGRGRAPNGWTCARGRRAGRLRRPPAPGRAVDRPPAHARRADGAALALGGEVLRARGRRVVGRRDDGHAARLAGRRAQGRRDQRLGHLRHAKRVVVRVDGDHAVDVRARARPVPTRSRPTSTSRARSPTATCPRTTTTAAAASPACPTRAGCWRAPCAATAGPSSSPASSTARGTSARPAGAAGPRSSSAASG